MSRFGLQVLGQVDDADGIKGALLDADAATDTKLGKIKTRQPWSKDTKENIDSHTHLL